MTTAAEILRDNYEKFTPFDGMASVVEVPVELVQKARYEFQKAAKQLGYTLRWHAGTPSKGIVKISVKAMPKKGVDIPS